MRQREREKGKGKGGSRKKRVLIFILRFATLSDKRDPWPSRTKQMALSASTTTSPSSFYSTFNSVTLWHPFFLPIESPRTSRSGPIKTIRPQGLSGNKYNKQR